MHAMSDPDSKLALCSIQHIQHIVEIDSSIYDNPLLSTDMYTVPREEKTDIANPIYETMDCAVGEYEVAEESNRQSDSAKFDSSREHITNPTYKTLDCAAGEYQVEVERSTLMESTTFDDDIYSR